MTFNYSTEWVNQFGTASNFDQTQDLAIDALGNTYVVGNTTGSIFGDNAGFFDGFLAKFDRFGSLEWARQIATSRNDFVNTVAVDPLGNIFIAGRGSSAAPNLISDAFVTRFDPAGNQLWSQPLGATTGIGGIATVNDLAFDNAGNLYVTGSAADSGSSNFDIFTAKYSIEDGSFQWFRSLGTPGTNDFDEGFGIAVDSVGSVYVSGSTRGGLGGPNQGLPDAFLLKYDTAGDLQWVEQFGTPFDDSGDSVAIDSEDNVFVVGETGGSLGGNGSGEAYIARFDSDGNRIWTTQFGGSLPTNANDIEIDAADNIFVAGASQNGFGNENLGTWDAYFLRFNQDGQLQQGDIFGTSSLDRAAAIQVDAEGNVFLAGITLGILEGESAGATDFFAAKLRFDGITNLPPDAVDDDVSTNETTPIDGNVLGNDTDADQDTLIVAAVNGDTANVGIPITLPSGAILTLSSNGDFEYDPNGQFAYLNNGEAAQDSFIYTASDGRGETDDATVNIAITGQSTDLVATAFDVVTDHVLGGVATLSYTLANQGSLDVGAFEVQVVYSNDDVIGNADDEVVDTLTISELPAGDSLTGTVDVQLPIDALNANALAEDPTGQATGYISNNLDYVGLVIDSGNAVFESDEANNFNQGKGIDKDDITYFPWDIDSSGQVTPSDAIFVINRLGQTTNSNNALADFDGSGQITPSDAIAAINRLGYSIYESVFDLNT
jgi:hypothetical protein